MQTVHQVRQGHTIALALMLAHHSKSEAVRRTEEACSNDLRSNFQSLTDVAIINKDVGIALVGAEVQNGHLSNLNLSQFKAEMKEVLSHPSVSQLMLTLQDRDMFYVNSPGPYFEALREVHEFALENGKLLHLDSVPGELHDEILRHDYPLRYHLSRTDSLRDAHDIAYVLTLDGTVGYMQSRLLDRQKDLPKREARLMTGSHSFEGAVSVPGHPWRDYNDTVLWSTRSAANSHFWFG